MVKNLFWNRPENRLRSGWRVLVQIVLASLPLSILALFGVFSSDELTNTRVMISALSITVASVLFLGRFIDKRKYSDYGILLKQRKWWAEYGFGILVGFLAASLLVCILVLLGFAEIELSDIVSTDAAQLVATLPISLVTYAGVGIFEETLRVYQIRNITEGLANTKLGTIGAVGVAVLLAGIYSVAMHIASGDPLFLLYVLMSGMIYGSYYLLTQRAALAMASHFAWDFTVSFIFLLGGSNVGEPALFVVPINQVTGIDTGTLIPILGMLVRLIGLVLVLLWIRWRKGKIRLHKEIAAPSLLAEESPTM